MSNWLKTEQLTLSSDQVQNVIYFHIILSLISNVLKKPTTDWSTAIGANPSRKGIMKIEF